MTFLQGLDMGRQNSLSQTSFYIAYMSGPDYVGHFPPADLVLSPELHATINSPAEVRTVGRTSHICNLTYLLSWSCSPFLSEDSPPLGLEDIRN